MVTVLKVVMMDLLMETLDSWKVDLGVAFILGIDFLFYDDSISLVSTGVSPTFSIDGDGVGDEDEAVVDAEVKDVGEVEDKFSDPLLPVLLLFCCCCCCCCYDYLIL